MGFIMNINQIELPCIEGVDLPGATDSEWDKIIDLFNFHSEEAKGLEMAMRAYDTPLKDLAVEHFNVSLLQQIFDGPLATMDKFIAGLQAVLPVVMNLLESNPGELDDALKAELKASICDALPDQADRPVAELAIDHGFAFYNDAQKVYADKEACDKDLNDFVGLIMFALTAHFE